jgi:Asp-tRNA(Asn)/Glu-tRNA(Gln) amidotransferase A subunit family amidase
VIRAQRFRRWYRDRVAELFRDVDIVLAPATPGPAPLLGDAAGRAQLGIYTQPLSFIGLPIVVAPRRLPGELPVGVQIVAAPWREEAALRVARVLEREGVAVV